MDQGSFGVEIKIGPNPLLSPSQQISSIIDKRFDFSNNGRLNLLSLFNLNSPKTPSEPVDLETPSSIWEVCGDDASTCCFNCSSEDVVDALPSETSSEFGL
jgi:hypothetical protein